MSSDKLKKNEKNKKSSDTKIKGESKNRKQKSVNNYVPKKKRANTTISNVCDNISLKIYIATSAEDETTISQQVHTATSAQVETTILPHVEAATSTKIDTTISPLIYIATSPQVDTTIAPQVHVATSAKVDNSITSPENSISVLKENHSTNIIETERNIQHDRGLSDKQNVSTLNNCTSIIDNSINIPKDSYKENKKFQTKPKKNDRKSCKTTLKNKLKVAESYLAEALQTIESYRNLSITKQKELQKWQDLNAQLQNKIYEKVDEYASRDINPFEQIAKGDADVGYLRKSDNMNKKGSEYSGFVRHIAETIFGTETLKNSSVTGKQSGRTKAPAKPKLDPKLLGAVIGIFKYYLAIEVKLDPVRVAQEVKSTGEHIASKIADMNRKSKKKICDPEGASDNVLEEVEAQVTVNLYSINQPESSSKNEEGEGSDADDDESDNDDDDDDDGENDSDEENSEDEIESNHDE
ncbi:uncharacterized protein LOC131674647 [Phymastichus coffea]|uniref:uncharacterized protein LOC131674647 n=1 Tax=Phymastichus coffea TaxID=108790 RepID=UPI00273A9327|nr:uncharacterized protein LOC131674647 [Phymastichus coffea]